MKQPKRIRIGNIEFRLTPDGSTYLGEIVCWYPNDYYYEKDKYEVVADQPDYYRSKEHNTEYAGLVHKNCFVHPESCYAVSFVTRDDDGPDILSVGPRPWQLSSEDRESYDEVVRYIYERCNQDSMY